MAEATQESDEDVNARAVQARSEDFRGAGHAHRIHPIAREAAVSRRKSCDARSLDGILAVTHREGHLIAFNQRTCDRRPQTVNKTL